MLRSLQALRRLDVSKWPFPTNADSLCALKNLTTLRLCDMYGLRLGPLLGGLTDLQHLTLLECGTAPLSSLRWASSLQTLRSLHVRRRALMCRASCRPACRGRLSGRCDGMSVPCLTQQLGVLELLRDPVYKQQVARVMTPRRHRKTAHGDACVRCFPHRCLVRPDEL